jgi:hypothetical protein
LSVFFGFFFFPFVISSFARISKSLHDQQYRLKTLRDWLFFTKPKRYWQIHNNVDVRELSRGMLFSRI